MREEEEDTEDDDFEAPYLAPMDRARANDYSEEGPLTSSSESISILIDLEQDEDIPPCPTLTPPMSRKAVCPATLELAKDKKAAAVLVENTPFSHSPLTKANQERRAPLRQPREDRWQKKSQRKTSYTLMMTSSPLTKLEAQVDKLLMPSQWIIH